MPERRGFTQTISLEESLAKEATQLRKQAQATSPGVERDFLFAKPAGAETASHMTRWPVSGYRHQDKFN